MAVGMRVAWEALVGGSLDMSWSCIPSNVHLTLMSPTNILFFFETEALNEARA